MQSGLAIDHNRIGTLTMDIRTHGDKAVCQVYYLRLFGSVFNDGLPIGKRSRHEDVFGTSHGTHVHKYVTTPQPAIY